MVGLIFIIWNEVHLNAFCNLIFRKHDSFASFDMNLRTDWKIFNISWIFCTKKQITHQNCIPQM